MSTPWIAAFAFLWLAVIAVGVVMLGTLRRITSVLERAESQLEAEAVGVRPMSVLPSFELYDASGDLVTSESLIREPTILLFMESGCSPCRQLALALEGFDDTVDGVPFVVVLDDSPNARQVPIPPDIRVMYEREGAVSGLFESAITPQAFVIDVGGVVLDRKRPRNRLDLRELAWLQREGGATTTTRIPESAA